MLGVVILGMRRSGRSLLEAVIAGAESFAPLSAASEDQPEVDSISQLRDDYVPIAKKQSRMLEYI